MNSEGGTTLLYVCASCPLSDECPRHDPRRPVCYFAAHAMDPARAWFRRMFVGTAAVAVLAFLVVAWALSSRQDADIESCLSTVRLVLSEARMTRYASVADSVGSIVAPSPLSLDEAIRDVSESRQQIKDYRQQISDIQSQLETKTGNR